MLPHFRLLSAVAIAASLLAADRAPLTANVPYNIPLWEEGKVPLATGDSPLDAPFVTVFLPPDGKRNGTSVGVAPGGGVVGAAKAANASGADPLDRVSSRPDYLVLVYGPGRATPGEQLKDFPPTFLLAAAFDRGSSNGSAQLFIEMNHAGAVAELHL